MDFDPTLKKKKKKKVVLEGDDDEAVEAVTGEMDDLEGAIPPVRPSIARWRARRENVPSDLAAIRARLARRRRDRRPRPSAPLLLRAHPSAPSPSPPLPLSPRSPAVEDFGKKKKKSSKKDKSKDEDGGDDDMDFGKKKKKKKKKDLDDEDEEDGGAGEDAAATSTGSGLPWDGTTRDYHYDELLGRVFGILREKNPALSEKTKTIIKPPQVLREGTKKTVFVNLMEICNAMHRSHEHVTQYLMAELGTSGTLDGQNRLIIKGRFLPKVFEGVLRHYFIDYVICQMCKSSDTALVKDPKTRLNSCVCQACGASRSVSAIQKGFQAVARGDRRKLRNAT